MALDDQPTQPDLQELARQAELARQGQRFVPANNPVPPMYPNPPGTSALGDGGVQGSTAGASDVVVPPTSIPAVDTARAPPAQPPQSPPQPAGPPRAVPPLADQAGASDPTQAILAARDTEGAGGTPAVEGQGTVIPGALSALGGAVKGAVDVLNRKGTEGIVKALNQGGSLGPGGATTSSTQPGTVAPSGTLKPGGAVSEAVKKEEAKDLEEFNFKGAPGEPAPATTGRHEPEKLPPVTPKANISPRAYVELEQTNKPLYDAITHVAATQDMSPWELTNLVYAASKNNPNYNSDGRVGLTGLTQQDIATYQQQYPDLFKDPQGNPVSAADPYTNLTLGALKYKNMQDLYGRGTPSSIVAYYMGPGRNDQMANATPEEQRRLIPEAARTFTREAIDPHAEPGSAPKDLKLTGSGTTNAIGAANAAFSSIRAGDPSIFASWQADNLPRGMSANDGWRHTEALMVGAMIAKGDMVGAQHARELVFQMSHVGANQALMGAHQALLAGDNEMAAQQLAKAYYYMPDGGVAKFFVTPQGVIAQRFNEQTQEKVGAPFQITAEKVAGLLNQTQDPQSYMKMVRENQKTLSDLAHVKAQTELAEAQAKDIPLKRETAEDLVQTRQLNSILQYLAKGQGKTDELQASNAIENELNRAFEKNPATNQIQEYPGFAQDYETAKDMKMNNRTMSTFMSKDIAVDLRTKGGRYEMRRAPDGWGGVFAKGSDQLIAKVRPAIAQQYQPVAQPPQSPIGATPAPAR